MVVICPKCKIKLKIADEKISRAGSRFKCPKCSTVLLVKKPAPAPEKPVDNIRILVAHSNPSAMHTITTLLNNNGYQTVTATDGIEAMVKSIKELPFLAVVEVSLPKIYGIEVCKRLRLRPETKHIKFILISSPYDKTRYKRDPESLYDADDHIEDHQIAEQLMDSVNALRKKESGIKEPAKETPEEKAPEEIPAPQQPPAEPGEKYAQPVSDDKTERARRLARTIVSDIYLYNTAKAEESIRNNTFMSVFSSELREGLKLYESRISPEVRNRGDFFMEVIHNFIENKKKSV